MSTTDGGNPQMEPSTIDDPEVLIVDDDESIANMNTYRVEEIEGFKAKTAYNGQQALELISTNTDVVLLDRRMPKMNGDEVLKRIHDIGYNTQIVMVTAVDPDVEIADMGFDDYITKPVGKDTISAVIEDQMNIKRLNDVTNEIISIESKIEVLQDNDELTELESNDEYQKLKRRLESLIDTKSKIKRDLDVS
jgi:DNA-binding response OmpR family regulator